MKKKSLLLTAVAILGLTASTMAQNVPSYVPTNGLVGWWPFNGNAIDESGNGNNGTVNGSILDTDRFGNANMAYLFDGFNDSIELNLQQNNVITYSISSWFKTSVGGPILSGRGLSNQTGLTLHIHNVQTGSAFQVGKAMFVADGSPVSIGKTTVAAYNDNQWHHIVGVFIGNIGAISPSQFQIYVDNILISQTTNNTAYSATAPINNGTNLLIGAHQTWANGGIFNGNLDDIGIWNRALTQQEISDLYNAVNCPNNTSITPQTNSLTIGTTATFTATTSDPNPFYVWQSDLGQGFQTLNNFGNYSGVNTAILNIANVQLQNHTQPVRVITTSGNCIDTSNVSVINILDTCITNVTVYDTLLTTVTDTLIINTQITGINPPNNSNTITVFPNPASTHITIDYGNFAIMNGYQLVIENSIGQQVFQTNITQQSDYLSLSTWGGNGLYFVHIIDPQGNTIDIRKIVLQ